MFAFSEKLGKVRYLGKTYAWERPLLPQYRTAGVEEGLQEYHRSHTVGEEADEMRKRDVRYTVCCEESHLPCLHLQRDEREPTCPHAVMVHFHDTSSRLSERAHLTRRKTCSTNRLHVLQ